MPTLEELLTAARRHAVADQFLEAEHFYHGILAADPGCSEALFWLGKRSLARGNVEIAAEQFKRALLGRPDWMEAIYNAGLAYLAMRKWNEAGLCFLRALELEPNNAPAYNSLGATLYQLGRFEEAARCYREALRLFPEYVEALSNLGTVLRDQMMLDEAIDCCRRALALNPNHANAHYNLGLALHDIGKLEEAGSSYRRAIELNPQDGKAHSKRAMLLLLTSDFQTGWPEYEWRWKTGRIPVRSFDRLPWDGESLHGKTILLHAEQGLGDTIQFVRYAPLVRQFGSTVIFECQKPLVKLLAPCAGIDRLFAEGEELPSFDTHCPLLSLPRIFKTTVDTIPVGVPYLSADLALVALWREKLLALKGFRIGINWHGREGNNESHRRDFPLDCLAGLAQLPGVRLISLQKGAGRTELVNLGIEIFDPGDDVDTANGAFMDTAAIMMNLDLVITSDTSIPHLAGALGVPAWLALPYVPDWRWLLGRADSPWYPTMRLFRQKSSGDWPVVFAEIQTALRQLLNSP